MTTDIENGRTVQRRMPTYANDTNVEKPSMSTHADIQNGGNMRKLCKGQNHVCEEVQRNEVNLRRTAICILAVLILRFNCIEVFTDSAVNQDTQCIEL